MPQDEDLQVTQEQAMRPRTVERARPPSPWRGRWEGIARAGLLVVACAFSGAGHAQLQARNLDHAVGELVRTLVNEGRLSGQKVYVGADDFFEEENELRPPLSKILRTMCLRALTDRQVEVALVPAEAVQVLHGRWRRESETNLHLTLFVADPPRDQDEPVATRSADALVPVEGLRPRDIEPTLRHWGDRVVRRLERDLPGSGTFRLHLPPFPVQDEALSEKFSTYLLGRWRPAFTGNDRFTLVGSARSAEGVLHGDVFLVGEHIEIGLSIRDSKENPVASDHVVLEHSLFPFGMVAGGESGTPAGSTGSSETPPIPEVFRDCDDGCPQMVVVPAGSYEMGSPAGEAGRSENEGPVHRVTIAEPLAVGVYEVTVGEFGQFVGETGYSAGDTCAVYGEGTWKVRPGGSWRDPGFRQTKGHPVVCVSWEDARAYVGWLSRKTGRRYRLLSEAEWEYAARAETRTARYWGDGESGQCANENGADEALKRHYPDWKGGIASCDDGQVHTTVAGSYGPNGHGLHDVLGNVGEWVEDCWHDSYHGAPADGSAWVRGGNCRERVLRRGSWIFPVDLRSSSRIRNSTGIRFDIYGFRIARTIAP